MNKYSLIPIDNQDENYLVEDSKLAQFLENKRGIWLIQRVIEYIESPMTEEEKLQEKLWRKERTIQMPLPLSEIDALNKFED
jgi:hypothetical protein